MLQRYRYPVAELKESRLDGEHFSLRDQIDLAEVRIAQW